MKLDVVAGAGIRFEPGIPKTVRLVQSMAIGLSRQGACERSSRHQRCRKKRRWSRPRPRATWGPEQQMARIRQDSVRALFGRPGRPVTAGDTSLLAEIEHDYTVYATSF